MAPTLTHATTASGTAYTVYRETLASYGPAVCAIADAHLGDGTVPMTLVPAHGAGGSSDQFATLTAWDGLRDWIIDHGYAFVEGAGADTETAGQQNWGNALARLCYPAYVEWAQTIISGIGALIPLGRSMGGVIAPWLYLRSPLAGQCLGMIGNSGVQTLTYGTVSDPNNDNRPSGQYFASGIYPAYGVTNFAGFTAACADFDPMNFDPSLWTGKNVLQVVGTADHTVPPATRGAYPLRAVYSGLPALDLLDVREGGDHTGTNGSYLEVDAMTSFINQLLGIAPVTSTYFEVTEELLIGTLGASWDVGPSYLAIP